MVNEIRYTSIRRILDNLLDHPMLRDLDMDKAIRYSLRFIQLNGFPKFYEDKSADIGIEKFRGLLPCDLVSITQVMDLDTKLCLRSMTNNFPKALNPKPVNNLPDNTIGNKTDVGRAYIPPMKRHDEEPSFKTQGRVIFTSFPDGCVRVSYKALPTDEDGFPMIPDDEVFLAALEAYIKMQVFTVKFDTGKIQANVLVNAQQDYAFRVANMRSAYSVPSLSEFESISRLWNTSLLSQKRFDNGFIHNGDREYIRRH